MAFIFFVMGSGAAARSQFVQEDIPHLPNFLGFNICLGIEAPADKPNWNNPNVKSTRRIASSFTAHKIIFDNRDYIIISEKLASDAECRGLPIDVAAWGASNKTNFCLKPWIGNNLIQVNMSETHSNPKNEYYLKRSIYAIGPCKIGESSDYYQYGEILKATTIHVHVQ